MTPPRAQRFPRLVFCACCGLLDPGIVKRQARVKRLPNAGPRLWRRLSQQWSDKTEIKRDT